MLLIKTVSISSKKKLTNFRQRRDEDPQRDDEGDLDSVELDVKHLVVVHLLMLFVPVVSLLGRMAIGGSMAVGSPVFQGTPQYYYRVTTRVDGPRDTVSVIQSSVLVGS